MKLLTEFFGNYPRIRVMDLLISHPYSEYSKTDIAESSNISRNTLYNFFEKLEEYNLIKPGKKYGQTQLFAVNTESPAVKALNAFQLRLAEIEIKKQMEIYESEEVKENNEYTEDELEKIFNIVDEEVDKEIFKRQEHKLNYAFKSTYTSNDDEKIAIEIFDPSNNSQVLYKHELFLTPSSTYTENKSNEKLIISSDSKIVA